MSINNKDLFECRLRYNGYNQTIAAESSMSAERISRNDAEERVENAKDDDFAFRNIVEDIHPHIVCEKVEGGDPTRGQNYNEFDDEVYDDELGW